MSKLVFRFLRFSLTLPEQSERLGMYAATVNAVALAPLYFKKLRLGIFCCIAI